MEIAYFAAGCFWGIEKNFFEMAGVCATAVGYMGGDWPNPTCLNYQGGDIGTQYRSAIFIVDEDQRQKAEASFQSETAGARCDEPIVTEIVPVQTFWRAEEYHQQYLAKRNR